MAHVFHRQPVPVAVAAAAAIAAAAVVVVLLLAGGGERVSAPSQHGPAAQTLNAAPGIRYDGGPEEGTADVAAPDDSALRGPGLRTD